MTSRLLGEFAESGFLNAAGGCCGTTPDHIRQIKAVMDGFAPRELPAPAPHTRFSGLEPFEITPESGFVTIGERTNITGSQRFKRLIESGDYAGAVQVALDQVRGGANLLDVNMDADLLDSETARSTARNGPCSRRASSAFRARACATRSASRKARTLFSRRPAGCASSARQPS